MREIKFRAWVKPIERMATVNGWLADSVFLETDSGSGSNDLKNVELMQFTGLHDRNGVEIYEGDIVKSIEIDEGRGQDTPLVVDWSAPGAAWVTYPRTYPGDWSEFEVIGNIYENPELLTPSNQQAGNQEEV